MIARGGHYEPIAREAFPYLIPPALLSLLFWLFGYPVISLLFLIATTAVALFFRNPERVPAESGHNVVISPADGKIVELTEEARSDNLPNGPFKRLSIFMSILDVHVNRSPLSGIVQSVIPRSGTFLDARVQEASSENERNSLVLQCPCGPVEVVQISGLIARKISCWVEAGDPVRQGDRIGIVHFGSRVDVYLPADFSFTLPLGARVRAGETVIARRCPDSQFEASQPSTESPPEPG